MAREFYRPPGGVKDSKGEWVYTCPACGREGKFYWNVLRQKGFCFGGSCGVSVTGAGKCQELFDLGLGGQAFGTALDPVVDVVGIGYQDYSTTPDICAWDYPVSRKFLSEARGLTERIVRQVPIGGDGNRIWVGLDPVSSQFPPVVYARKADGSSPWMTTQVGVTREGYLFGLNAWQASKVPALVMAEGVFDILAPDLYGLGVALMGSIITDTTGQALEARGCTDVYYVPDADEAGLKGLRQAQKVLRGWGMSVHPIQLGGRDPKQVTPWEMRTVLREAGWV